MNRIQDRSILFYSSFDPISKAIMTEMDKYPKMMDQFVLVQLTDSRGNINRHLPRLIKTILTKNPRKIPIFVPAGMNNVIFGEHALSMFKDGMLNNLGGLVTGTMRHTPASTAAVLDKTGNLTKRDLFQDSEFHMTSKQVESIKDFTQLYASADHVDSMLLVADTCNKKQTARDIRNKFEEARSIHTPTGRLSTSGTPYQTTKRVDPRPIPSIPPPPLMRSRILKQPKKPKKSKRHNHRVMYRT